MRRPTVRRTVTSCIALSLGLGAGLLVVGQGPADAVAAVVGAQTSGDTLFPQQGNGGYDVTHYDLDLSYAVSGSITATTTIVASTTGAPLSSYSLDLEGLTVSAVRVNDVAASFDRVDDDDTTKHKLVVTPTTPVSGAFTTVVTYAGNPTAHTDPDGSSEGWNTTADGAIFVNEPVGAMTGFPNNNTPSDKATYDISLTVPAVGGAGLSAISNGVLASKVTGTTSTTWNWVQSKPMASYLALIAIGSFTEQTDPAVDVGNGHSVPEWSYADSTDAASNLDAARAALPTTLQYISQTYGDYPGAATGLLADVSTLTYALETQDRPFFPLTIDTDTMTHELAHQWFGDSVSPCDWNDVWLNEGPATFVPVQYDHARDATQPTTEDEFYDLWQGTAATSTTWTTPTAAMTDPADLFGSHVYDRGAMALEALRSAVGTPTYLTIMRTWLARKAGGCGTTQQFIALTGELSGYDLTAFWRDWVYDADKPAWPATWDLDLAASPSAGVADTGDTITYTLTAEATGKVPLTDGVVTADLSEVLGAATLDRAALPAGLSISGATLTWTIPTTALGSTSSVSFPVVTKPGATNRDVVVTAHASSLGATCGSCSVVHRVLGSAAAVTAGPAHTGHPKVRLRGRAVVGSVLRIGVERSALHPGTKLSYRWYAGGTRIEGATSRRLRITADLRGHRLRAKITARAPGAGPLVLRSRRTHRVA